jgi:hypothetical protein
MATAGYKILCLAPGGGGGASLTGGSGGAFAIGFGDSGFNGAAGGAGRAATGTTTGAGGGSSGGTAANGNVGATSLAGGAGGAAPTGGSAGGSGASGAAGGAGFNGGGGAGGGSTSGAGAAGGSALGGRALVDGVNYTASGTHVVAAGKTSIVIECWGGGGGGQAGSTNVSAGAGGGGGAYLKSTVAVTPGDVLTINIGAAAAGGGASAAAGSAGAPVSVTTGGVLCLAAGGGSVGAGGPTGSVGGTAANSVGTTKFSGGAGGTTTGSSPASGGGSSAGTATNGNTGGAGGGGAGGAAPTGGGAGGAGVSTGNGNPGSAPGGGGGGPGSGGSVLGGAGGAGKVIVDGTTYSTPGTFVHTVAAGKTSIDIECWGGGGTGSMSAIQTGHAGGGGAYSKATAVAVVPGEKLAVIVAPAVLNVTVLQLGVPSIANASGFSSSVQALGSPFTFSNGTEGWVFNAAGGTGLTGLASTNFADSTNDSSLQAGVLYARRDGKSLTGAASYWEWTGTWEDLGVPVGAIVSAVNLDYDWQCVLYSTGASSSVGPAELRDNAGTLRNTISTAPTAVTATSAWAARTGTNQTGLSDDSNTPIKLRIGVKPNTGSSTSAQVAMLLDYVRVAVTYAMPVAPVGPSHSWTHENQLISEYGTINTTGGTVALTSAQAHSGTQSLRINRTSNADVRAQWDYNWDGNRRTCGSAWIRVASYPTATCPIIIQFFGTADNFEVRLSPTGQVFAGRQNSGQSAAASATLVPLNTWTQISWWGNSSTSTFEIKAAVGADTPVSYTWATTAETPAGLCFGSRSFATASLYDIYFDDAYTYIGSILPADPAPDPTAFPSVGVIDTFNRADVGPPPSASWSTDIRGQAKPGMRVVSNQLAASAGGPAECSTWWNATSFGADEDVFITQKVGGDFTNFQLWGRATNAGASGVTAYVLNLFHGGFNFQRYESSAYTALTGTITHVLDVDWGVGFRIRGTELTCWVKPPAGSWTVLARQHDAKLATGTRTGIALYDSNLTYDDYGAGTLVPAVASTYVRNRPAVARQAVMRATVR